MPDVYEADTSRIRAAPPTNPTITAEDVRTMMLSRTQAAQAREHAAQAIAHAEHMSVEDARKQVQQYEQQYRHAVDQAARKLSPLDGVVARTVSPEREVQSGSW